MRMLCDARGSYLQTILLAGGLPHKGTVQGTEFMWGIELERRKRFTVILGSFGLEREPFAPSSMFTSKMERGGLNPQLPSLLDESN